MDRRVQGLSVTTVHAAVEAEAVAELQHWEQDSGNETQVRGAASGEVTYQSGYTFRSSRHSE